MAAPVPEQLGPDGILGTLVSGDLVDWGRSQGGRLCLAYPEASLARHGVIIGAAGSGKTETLLRLAYMAARAYRWRVVFLDAKGDPATRDRFVAAMRLAGMPQAAVRVFPAQPYDGWRGDGRALVNRLMEVSDFSEPYYREMALRVLDLAISAPPGPPAASGDLLARLRKQALRGAYRQRPEAQEIEDLADRDIAGVANRYRAFFGALGGSLDGNWAFEEAQACYLLLEGLALKTEAARLGRYFLEDFAHYAGVRKAGGERVLLIVDEFSALESTADAAHLFERLRSFGAAVVVSAQGYAGLGRAGDRILDAAETLVLHRCAEPEPLISRAGTVARLEHTRFIDGGGAGRHRSPPAREGTVTRREGWRVRPNDVRQLPTGEAVVIAGGRAARVRVERVMPPQLSPGPPPGPTPGPTAGPTSDPAPGPTADPAPDPLAGPSHARRPRPTFHPTPPPKVPGL